MTENKKKDVVIDISKFEFISNELRRIDNPEIKKGYLKFACSSTEDKTALLAAYSASFPEDAENLELIAREIEADVKAKDEEKKDKTYGFDPLNIFKYIKELAEDLAILYGRAFKLAIENLEYLAPKRKVEPVEEMPEGYKDYLLTGAEREKEYYTVVDRAETERKAEIERNEKGVTSKKEKPSLLSKIKGLFARNNKPKVEKISLEDVNGNKPEGAGHKVDISEAKKREAYEASLARRRKEKAATYAPAEKSV